MSTLSIAKTGAALGAVVHGLVPNRVTDAQLADIVSYVTGTNTFTGAPHCGRKALLENAASEQGAVKESSAVRNRVTVDHQVNPRWAEGHCCVDRSCRSSRPIDGRLFVGSDDFGEFVKCRG